MPYELRQVSREWNVHLDMVLIPMGCKKSYADPTLYLNCMEDGSVLFIASLDNTVTIGNLQGTVYRMVSSLNEKFEVRVPQKIEMF